ncbi:MAG: hypothetical protein CYG59_24825 [Chloroflexi bacterium]|nr:MAG: hypothetical protein CYG59_24825 [Chloroflexota bacterium]
MPWERFTGRATTLNTKPTVGLSKKGEFTLAPATVQLAGGPEYVVLLFDREAQKIGFQPATPNEPGALPIRKPKKGVSYVVSGKSFTSAYNIPLDQYRQWVAKKEGNILVIDLAKPAEVNETDHEQALAHR